MKRVAIASILLILILGTVAVLYFDIFNLRFARQAAFAGIISSEDTRRVSSRFDKYLSDHDPAIRGRAALAIGRIGDPKAAEHLFRLLNDSSSEVAQTAAFAIGLTGKKIFAERLLDSTTYLPPEVLTAAIQSIGRLSDSMMTDIILALTSYLSHNDPRVREQAAYALWRAGAKSSWEKLANICRRDQVRPVQAAALYALSRMGIKEATDLYEEWLPDIDPSLRSMAYRGVALSRDDNKIPLVACGLNDKNNNVVSQAVTSLTSTGSPKAIKYLANQYPGESDEKLKVQYLESFARLGSDAASEYARNEIENDSSSINVRVAAIVYLAKIEKENSLPLIDSLAEMKSIYLNANIAQALSEIGGDAVKPRLVSLFDDSAAYVRAAAFEALCTIDKPNLDFYLNKALQDKDFVIRSLAVDKIGQLKDGKYLKELMNIIKMGKDASVDLKRSVVSAAGEFIGTTAEDSLVEDIIYHGLMDEEYLVSRDAADIYMNKLGIDKYAYVTRPTALIGERRIKAELNRYKKNPLAIISTNQGEIEMELLFDVAPLTVYSFVSLAKQGFYDNLIFHRVVPNFVIQGGDPRGDGWGGPGYSIRDEYSNLSFKRGTVGIAHSGKDSGGSQFFIMLSDQPHLDGRYTLFGRVTRGINVVDKIVRGDTIKHISIIEAKTK